MKNFSINIPETGETVWISRSITVVGFIFIKLNDTFYILANKRGKGTPNCQGLWNCPGGFLDYDERICEGASREVLEETGFKVDPDSLILYNINDKYDTSKKQNVTFRYYKIIRNVNSLPHLSLEFMEKDEVEDVKWIPINEINEYKWAFGHKQIINDILKTYFMNDKTLSLSDLYFFGVLLFMLGISIFSVTFNIELSKIFDFFWVVFIPPVLVKIFSPTCKFTKWFFKNRW